ncbi:hypothetical protein [Pseudomonas fluorescens]|uniref:hypothetical protein n=1 Tax=Pseudomonas fluorescens TaxID=294 RepID=UPI001783D069|nr:hypothetical protein [Pseudomonas fluorescens]
MMSIGTTPAWANRAIVRSVASFEWSVLSAVHLAEPAGLEVGERLMDFLLGS